MTAESDRHTWTFRARFRRHSFGWKSQPAIKRIKEAVAEINKVARKDEVLAAEGAVLADQTRQRIHDLVATETFGERFVTKILGRQLGLS